MWLKRDYKKWLRGPFVPVAFIGIPLNHLLYYLLFNYVAQDSFIFYIFLFAIGAIISATLGSLIHSTLGYLTGSYGTGAALILYGILPSSSPAIVNSGLLYLAVVMLSIYSGLLAGRLSWGIINYGFTVSTIEFHFENISPYLLESEILAIGKEAFKEPWFDKTKPSKTYGCISTKDAIIFENGLERGIYGSGLTELSEFSFKVELRNRIWPLFIQFNKIVNNEKAISRILLKVPAKDIEIKDFVYIDNKYYEIVGKETLGKTIKIKLKDIFSDTLDSQIEKEYDNNKQILISVKSLPEIIDNFVNPFAWISSDIIVKIDFLKKSVYLVILTDERTTTKAYVTPYSFQSSYQIHKALIEKFKDAKDLKENGPVRIYKKMESSYLNDLDFEANYVSELDVMSISIDNSKINLINSIPASYFIISSFDKLRKRISAKVAFAAISSSITTTLGLTLKITINLIT